MNKLIADSGSTKTAWILITDDDEEKRFKTDGLNPYYRTEDELATVIKDDIKKYLADILIDEIYFYGAGCGRKSSQQIVKNALSANFSNADICVDSDLLAAARACFGNDAGVVCILGTGSNSCLYDGNQITESIPSLGFTLGDEGSGGYFGKKIIHSYFYKTMPRILRKEMEQRFDMDLDTILKKVYNEPLANRFVASFAQLLWDFKDHPFIKKLLQEGLEDFADNQLGYFDNLKEMKVGFVGSIAAIHKEILEKVLVERGMELEIIVQRPIDRLVQFHQKG